MISSKSHKLYLILFTATFLSACGDSSSDSANFESITCDNGATSVADLHGAFQEMNSMTDHPNVSAALSADGCTVVVTSTGQPDHTSIYWEPGHPLNVDPIDEVNAAQKAPGFMTDEGAREVTRTVWANPQLATAPTSPGIGTQGESVSGGPIFSQYEGFINGNFVPLETGVALGFDRDGGHANFGGYHYHLEPTASIVLNGDELIGVMNDGFFLYGSVDWETGTIPNDLDTSGGHVGLTQFSSGEEEYHYHSSEEFMDTGRNFAFPYDFRGSFVETADGGDGGGGGMGG